MIRAILNIKGGVGKSLTAEMFGRGFAREGRRTLLVDADGQADLTDVLMPDTDFEDDPAWNDRTIVAFLKGRKPITECIVHTGQENLDLIPSSMDLFSVVYELQGIGGADFLLGNALRKLDYDEIIIDNNPSINKMTFNAIFAADEIVCPTNIGRKTLKGVTNTRRVCEKALDALPFERPLNFRILFNMMGRNGNSREGSEKLRRIYGSSVYETEIRFQQKPVQDAEFTSRSLLENEKAGVAEDYRRLIRELLGKEEGNA